MAEAHLGPSFGDEGDTHQAALMASSGARTGGPLCSASRSVTDQLPHLGGREPDAVRVARVSEARSGSLASFPGAERPGGIERLDHEHPVVLERLAALVLGDEDLVELFTGANTDVLDRTSGRHRRDQVEDPHTGDLWDDDLATPHELGAADRKFHALLEPHPEARHGPIRHRYAARHALGRAEWDHAAPAADDVAVADDTEHGAARAAVRVALNEELLGARSEEHTSELQSPCNLVCRLLLEKKKTKMCA